jgi:3'(2'), 5'-bisphosphate nucleotidase
MDIEKALRFSKMLAYEAGAAIMDIYRQDFDVEFKDDESPLTQADKTANTLILAGLKAEFPDAAYLSEEEKDDRSRLKEKYCFIIDPLDGTKEFVKKNGEFTVNIALVKNGKPIMGVVYAPVLGEMYFALKGSGAFLEDTSGHITPLSVTNHTENLKLVASKSHGSEKLDAMVEANQGKIAELVSYGSSLKGCMVAAGSADIYYRFGLTCEWDTCAMQAVVECAGGIMMQMDKTPMMYNRENTLNEKGFFIVNRKENIFV